jgi:hypothetical protein
MLLAENLEQPFIETEDTKKILQHYKINRRRLEEYYYGYGYYSSDSYEGSSELDWPNYSQPSPSESGSETRSGGSASEKISPRSQRDLFTESHSDEEQETSSNKADNEDDALSFDSYLKHIESNMSGEEAVCM